MLYQEIRPKTLDEVVGNKGTVTALKAAVAADPKDRAHAFMFHGPSGCGKTTLARILATAFGAVPQISILEYNASSSRGIDTIRELESYANTGVLGSGKARAIIMDECFVEGTLVTMADGSQKPIEKVSPGDSVLTMTGPATVQVRLTKSVDSSRIGTIKIGDVELTCTDSHKIWTNKGWMRADSLTPTHFFASISSTSRYNSLRTEGKNATRKDLRTLWKTLQNGQQTPEVLWLRLFSQEQGSKKAKSVLSSSLRMVQRAIHFTGEKSKVLLQVLRSQARTFPSPQPALVRGDQEKDFRRAQKGFCRTARVSQNLIGTNENQKSYETRFRSTEGIENIQREGGTTKSQRGQRTAFACSATNAVGCSWMGSRISDFFRRTSAWLSDMLQSRFGKSRTENSHRSRRTFPSLAQSKSDRSKEGFQVSIVGLGCSSFFQHGRSVQSFRSLGNNKSGSESQVVYDLQIDGGHPSYFANGILVHNCHALTRDAQNALLKILEEVPLHTYYFLCTTEPAKLLKTIHTRCQSVPVVKLGEEELITVLERAMEKAGIPDPGDDVILSICDAADGSPRQAVVMLEQQRGLSPEDALKAVQSFSPLSKGTKELCSALISGKWITVLNVYKNLEDKDPEAIRRAALGYLKGCLINSGSKLGEAERFANMIVELDHNTFDSGEPALLAMLFRANQIK